MEIKKGTLVVRTSNQHNTNRHTGEMFRTVKDDTESAYYGESTRICKGQFRLATEYEESVFDEGGIDNVRQISVHKYEDGWYKDDAFEKRMVFISKGFILYGINAEGHWFKSRYKAPPPSLVNSLTLLNNSDTYYRLIVLADKCGVWEIPVCTEGGRVKYKDKGLFVPGYSSGTLYSSYGIVLDNGVWAEKIIEKEPQKQKPKYIPEGRWCVRVGKDTGEHKDIGDTGFLFKTVKGHESRAYYLQDAGIGQGGFREATDEEVRRGMSGFTNIYQTTKRKDKIEYTKPKERKVAERTDGILKTKTRYIPSRFK